MYYTVPRAKNFLRKRQWSETKWIDHILHRRCLSETRYGSKDKGGGTREKTYEQLMDDKENGKYWNLIEETLYRTLLINRIGRGYGTLVRLTTLWINLTIFAKTVALLIDCAQNRLDSTELNNMWWFSLPKKYFKEKYEAVKYENHSFRYWKNKITLVYIYLISERIFKVV
jgi:hypothetical protein